MSVQIKVSYETEAELHDIVQRLYRPGMKVQTAEQKGKFKRVYIKYNGTALDKTEQPCYNPIEQMFAK